jgi:N6-adenosine-specific RNA methylase IME4
MSAVDISSIIVGDRHRRDMGDLQALANSIADVGLLQPIGLSPSNTLVFGERRLRACRDLLGWTEIPARVVDVRSLVEGEAHENEIRKDFSPSERVAIERTINAELERRQGQRADQAQHVALDCDDANFRQNIAVSDGHRVSKESARLAGFGNRETARQARAVVEAAEHAPEKYGRLVEAMDRSGVVGGVYKRLVVAQKAEVIAAEPPPLPTGPFRTIVADPPWHYARDDDPSHRGSCPYPTLTVPEICAMPVAGLAADDAVLWLWTTNPNMRAAFHVLDAWGFEERTMLTWVKPHFGTGHWLRGQTEHCLLAVRGRPTVTLTNQASVLHAPSPQRQHSRKPDEFYALVESLCPGSKLELFCRHPRPGWASHGDEAVAA